MEHTRVISAWQYNDELRVDALVVSGDGVSVANGIVIHLFIRSVYLDEYFRRGAIRDLDVFSGFAGVVWSGRILV